MSSHDVEGEPIEIRWRKAESESVSIDLPKTAIASLEKVAQNKDMSVKAFLKFYIGRGLRLDLSDLSANQFLDAGAEVLIEIRQKSEQMGFPSIAQMNIQGGDRAVHHS
jgi:hypothetical protein